MADWQRHLKLQPEWGQAQDGEITINQLATIVSTRLAALPAFNDAEVDDERDEIVWEFANLAKDPDATEAEFDWIMDQLYDWGDTKLDDGWPSKKVCWIDWINKPVNA